MSQLYRTLTGQSQKSQQSSSHAHSHAHQSNSQTAQQEYDSTPGAPLQRTTTTDPLTGVLNHLTDQQNVRLEQFKIRLEKDGWWSPHGINGKPTHDDGTLLRYLRARKFEIEGAVAQFSDTEKWMKNEKVEELYEHFDVEFYERARLMYPQWTGHRDKRGIPIYVYEIKGLDSKHVSKYQKESAAYKDKLPNHKKLSTPPKNLPLFALYHNLLNFVLPLVSSLERPHPEIPVTNSTNIVDISNVGLTQFWNLKQHMQDASVLATAHYPETLDRIFIIGAPSFFPTVWGWVKRWFDPVTVSKIFILGKHEVKPTLLSFMDPKSFPKKYGGELDWSWGDIPALDEEAAAAVARDGHKGWVKGPCLWLDHERLIVGSENGKLRRAEKEIAEKKPVVYAADYTEDPVHPDRKASVISKNSVKGKKAPAFGEALAETTTSNPGAPSSKPSEHANTTAISAAGTGASMTNGQLTPQASSASSSTPAQNVRNSPMGDSQVVLPDAQPAAPATTAEYISPTPSAGSAPATSVSTPAPVAAVPVYEASAPSPAQASAPSKLLSSAAIAPHPAGQTQPGPIPKHTVALTREIAHKMEGESTIIIPADGNGPLPHPEIIATTDKSKGLAMEADRLALAAQDPRHPSRPQPERFVTAVEF